MQQEQSNKKGRIIFAAIVFIFLVLGIFVYNITGNKGIEVRFSNALGLPGELESSDNGMLGFTLEGNQFFFGIIVLLILVGTALFYLKYRI